MQTSADPLIDRDGSVDVYAFFARLRAARWWMFLSCLAFGVLFGFIAFSSTPIYRATTVLVDASTERVGLSSIGSGLGQLGGLASLAGISVGSGASQLEESLAVLRSREFTEGFIRDQNLMTVLFADRWDAATGKWLGDESDWPTLGEGAKLFANEVRTLSQDRRTGLVTLGIEWKDPQLAADWANALVARLNGEMRARAIAAANASKSFLEQELAGTSVVETRAAIVSLLEGQINQRMLATVAQEFVFRVADRALPPDPRDPVRPNKLVLLLIGPAVGLVVGIFVVLLAGFWANIQPQKPRP